VSRRALLRLAALAGTAAAALAATAAPSLASGWLPHPADATWTYQWTDSRYNQIPTDEKVTVQDAKASTFTLAWTTADLNNPDGAPDSQGTVTFGETNGGVDVASWSSNPPPDAFPVLCAQASQCGNSLAGTWYAIIWGSRTPLLSEPLMKGATWSSTGGSANDVTSTSRYLGQEKITVPAFSAPVTAAKVRTEITQTGALGDPYGSGIRTVWWVWGIGPVKVSFAHAGGTGAPVTSAVLESTSLTPPPPPPDDDFFPFVQGKTATYRWTNARYLPQPVVEKVTTGAVSNGSAELSVASVSGPIKVQGTYGYTLRLDGLTGIWSTTSSASLAKLPPLGPSTLPPSKRRHFVTPFDLMDFGFNPIMPAYPQPGVTWSAASTGRDFQFYGVSGTSKVLGMQTVTVPAGTFRALAVQTTLRQPGFRFGSGTRTSWFAPGRGLVELVFHHDDGSTSRVELLK
jgi:hypothetical protein